MGKPKKKNSEWPHERNILFRPDRLKYVKNLIPRKGCVFCEAAGQEPCLGSLCCFQTEHSLILLNKYPYNPGHLLVMPRAHKGQLLELTEFQYQDLHQVLRIALQALEKTLAPEGVNVGLNLGRAAGAGIPDHLHYHLVPRWPGDLNFFPLIAETKVVVETLEQTYTRMIEYFKGAGEGA